MIREMLIYSRFEVGKTVQSKICEGETMNLEAGIHCPHCRIFIENVNGEDGTIKHGETIKCPSCGLRMTRWGNGLECVL